MSKLLLGDCLDILPTLATDSVDMVLTDLPYGMTRNSWDSIIDLEQLWPELLRVTKKNAAIVMTSQQPFTSTLVASQLSFFRYEWIWEKPSATGHFNARKMPLKAHENIFVFYRTLPTYNPTMLEGADRKVSKVEHKRSTHWSPNWGRYVKKGYDSTTRFPRSVIKFSSDKQRSSIHPTQKPVALFEYLIKTYSNEGETILDVAGGSATTAVAARNLGREYIVIERDEVYFGAAVERLAA